MSLIELTDLDLLFEDNLVLDEINITFRKGECTIIIGPSGCGKSSLLKVAAGLIPPSHGKVRFQGNNIDRMNEKQFQAMQFQTGFIFQDSALWANKSLYENLTFPILVAQPRMSRADLDALVQGSVNSMNFRESLALRPAALSSGEMKILSFLRATISDPDIVFMDEPTTFVDRKSVGLMKKRILELKEQGKTLIGITHDGDLALQLADRFIFLNRGRVLADGAPQDLLQSDNPGIQQFMQDLLGIDIKGNAPERTKQ